MSQSPESAVRRSRYEDGWEAINRMIREEGSWSGHERNSFLVGCDDGSFVDASAASGLDFIEDGRAFAVLDYDGDGDPDLVLRNRNGPRVRVLRNVFRSGGRSVWFHLTARRGNRDAIGAVVEIESARGRRRKAVEAGSGFLSQHTRWLWFGLGATEAVRAAHVRWQGGAVQELGALPADRRYRVVEGEAPRAEPFGPEPRPEADPAAAALAGGAPPQASPEARVWLIDPLTAPDFALKGLDGRVHALRGLRGRPALLLFISPDCGACVSEVARLAARRRSIESAGGTLLAVAIGRSEIEVRERFGGASFPVLLGDELAARSWNAVHRSLFNRYRNLAVPTAFLLNAAGEIEKVYRGRFKPEELEGDLEVLRQADGDRRRRALPFPGTVLKAGFQRDLFLVGAALTEAGAAGAAADAFRAALGGNPGDAEAHYNLGLALQGAGDGEGAARAYREALAARPDMVDALNNLGILEARAGRIPEARKRFEEALARQPGQSEASLNLASTFIQEGRVDQAERIYREALRGDPESRVLWCALGYALFQGQRIDEGIEAFRRALALAPADPDALAGLANLLMKRGGPSDLAEARAFIDDGVRRHPRNLGLLNALGLIRSVFEDFPGSEDAYARAIAADPRQPAPYLNLARLRLKRGDRSGAARALRELLAIDPDNPDAQALLRN